jgi:hypothetical protein
MYVDHSEDEDKPITISRTYAWAMGIAAIVVILLGTVAVQPVFLWAVESASALFAS